jgi:nitric oxide reductase activation protein
MTMQRFIQFNDEKIDSFLYMELNDLCKSLTKNKNIEMEYSPNSYLDLQKNKIFVSHFWHHRSDLEERMGLKSDVYLRALGNYNHSNFTAWSDFSNLIKNEILVNFGKQLFIFAEDLRVEELCKQMRPGTRKAFEIRRNLLKIFFETQLEVNLTKGVYTDSLFCLSVVLLQADAPIDDIPSITPKLDLTMPFVQSQLHMLFQAKSSGEVAKIILSIVEVIGEYLPRDMLNEYYHFPSGTLMDEGLTFKDLKRKDPLDQLEKNQEKTSEEKNVIKEEMKTWHRETEKEGEVFLEFELERGSQSNIIGSGEREGEDVDQTMAVVQGKSRENKDFQQELDPLMEIKTHELESFNDHFGKENRYAREVNVDARMPTYEEKQMYDERKKQVSSYQKKLVQMIQKTLEHKKTFPRSDLSYGRLSKKLLPFYTDEYPRLFYKKQNESKEIDASFTLLVDCSASMYDKMDDTKLGTILFHETLKAIRVHHEVIGFWEDSGASKEKTQPNYFKTVISYSDSLNIKNGAKILQLEPEDDNRDGFAIRVVTKKMEAQSAKQKFILIFSDGEPAAFNYEQNGIVDTHEAVLRARKRGIEVINVFLSDGKVDEGTEKTIRTIYGTHSLIVEKIEELPETLFPLLRKLLLKSMG